MEGLYGIELIFIYTYTFSNLADTFIQRDLQMRTMDMYMYYVCVFQRWKEYENILLYSILLGTK